MIVKVNVYGDHSVTIQDEAGEFFYGEGFSTLPFRFDFEEEALETLREWKRSKDIKENAIKVVKTYEYRI